ncbi:MAG: redoxin family protein [Planctomycetes bacterium]|nr:redoxin family protein [Planctomycetota bacterium]
MSRHHSTLLLALIAFASVAGGETVTIRVIVTDAKGKALRDVTVGIGWTGDEKRLSADQSVTTGKDGRFSHDFDVESGKPVGILAVDKVRKNGAFVELEPADLKEEQKIEIDDLVTVTGSFDVKSIRGNPETVEMVFESAERAPAIRYTLGAKKRFSIKMPPGKYVMSLGCSGGEREAREVNIGSSRRTHDLGAKLVLSPTVSSPFEKKEKPPEPEQPAGAEKTLVGRNPPLMTVSDAIGVPKTVQAATYRGKWVLIDFWGYWCGPCVTRGLPELFRFAEEHKAQADRFVILTFHHSKDPLSEPDLATIRPQIDRLLKDLWKRDRFPFPILTDASHKTEQSWGVDRYPTAFLIDPNGKVVAQGVSGVHERLAEELAKADKSAEKPAEAEKPKKRGG